MSKMGWEKGKGLGANNQGQAEPIKVKMNIENRGNTKLITYTVSPQNKSLSCKDHSFKPFESFASANEIND